MLPVRNDFCDSTLESPLQVFKRILGQQCHCCHSEEDSGHHRVGFFQGSAECAISLQ